MTMHDAALVLLIAYAGVPVADWILLRWVSIFARLRAGKPFDTNPFWGSK